MMRKRIPLIMVIPILGLVNTNAFAVDGTITLNGVVIDHTCTLTGSGSGVSGSKNIMVTLDTVRTSDFNGSANALVAQKTFDLQLKNGAGTGGCGAATNNTLKGLFFETASVSDYDSANKTLLVNKASGASLTNPVYIHIRTTGAGNDRPINYAEAWGTQAKSPIIGLDADGNGIATMKYSVSYFTKTGSVDAQNVTAIVNYTLQYN